MTAKPSFFSELKRRHVVRAAIVYAVAVWALAQGISQLSPAFNLPVLTTRWFVIACAIGFPFWTAFAWYFRFTSHGIAREGEAVEDEVTIRRGARHLDYWIIGILAIAVVLLLTNMLVLHRNVTIKGITMAPTTTIAIPAKSIAVLPFENLSADKKNAYFVAGMQDLILTKLADIGDLKVIARTSTEKYPSQPTDLKAIAQQLGVATILEGSVQKSGNAVLIDVQLIDAGTGNHLWAQAYTRTLDNVFSVEGEVAGKIAVALKAKLSPAETRRLATALSPDAAANDLFLRAEYRTNRGNINYDTASWKAAIPLYRQAIEKDPNFALAYARLSYTESRLDWFGGGGMDVEKLGQQARADAEHALQLQPDLAAAHIALGYSDYYGRTDYEGALKAFAAALALRPNDADALAARGYAEREQDRFDAAIASLQQAFARDPRNSTLASELAMTCMMVNRYAEAETWFRRARALDPDNLNAKIEYAAAILYATGDVTRGLALVQGDDPQLKLARVSLLAFQHKYRQALALLASVPDTPDNFSDSNPKTLWQANLYRRAGDTAHARPLYTRALADARARLAVPGVSLIRIWQNIAQAELGLGHTGAGVAAIAKSQALAAKIERVYSVYSVYSVYRPESMTYNAGLYAEAGRADLAVPLLEKALASPGIGFFYSPVLLWSDPVWDPIRHDPRFQALLKKYAKYKPAGVAGTSSAATAATP